MKVKLEDVCEINMGQSPDSASYNDKNEGLPFYQGNADFGEIHPKTRIWCSMPIKKAKYGDILISVRAPIGALNIADKDCCIGRGLAALTPITDKINGDYLYYVLKSKVAELNSKGTGSTFKAISKKILEETLLPSMSLDEQEKIVSQLKKLSHLLILRQQQLEKLDLLVKSRFVEMFGDPILNDKNWNTKMLPDTGICKNGMNFSSKDTGISINCLGVGDFQDHCIIENLSNLLTVSLSEMPSEDYLLKDGDIIFVRSNGNKELVGRCVTLFPGNLPVTFSGFCIRYRKTIDALNTMFLLYLFKSKTVRQKMAGRGANIQNLNQQILGQIPIIMPPLELQNKFASFVQQVDKSKFSLL